MAISGCASSKHGDGDASSSQVARSLALLPDRPDLRRHVLVADLSRLAAAAAAIDPVTSAAFFDAWLVRPPSGVPVSVIAQYPARLVAIGIDDHGNDQRVVKIVLVYGDNRQAAADAALIEKRLAGSPLVGTQGARFSDISADWTVTAGGTAVTLSGRLPAGAEPNIWRAMAERGDLAILVRPAVS